MTDPGRVGDPRIPLHPRDYAALIAADQPPPPSPQDREVTLPPPPMRFACPGEDPAGGGDRHETIPVYRRCPRCREFAVAGFECDTCGYEDIDRPGRLPGHGPGRCELSR